MRLFTAAFLLVLATGVAPAIADQLVVDPLQGDAPLKVTITGPKHLTDKIAKCSYTHGWFGRGGNGVGINWGDGSNPMSMDKEGSCVEAQRTHIYTVPGTYKLTVAEWHPGPTDAPVDDWTGTATITVGGTAPSNSLTLLNTDETTVYRYQEFPRVKFNASVSKQSVIQAELIAQDGTVVQKMQPLKWSNAGEGEIFIALQNYDLYTEKLAAGQTTFKVRLSLLQDNEVKLVRETLFRNTLQYADSVQPLSVKAITGLKAEMNLSLFHPKCSSYRIEWGDGKKDEKIIPVVEGCVINQTSVPLTHTYAKAGAYKVRVYTNEMAFGKQLKDVHPYSEMDVTVK